LRTPPLRRIDSTGEISTACRVARSLLKEEAMRITTTLFVCSTLGACLPSSRIHHVDDVDAGGSNTTTQQTCDSPTVVTGDLTINGSDFSMVPSTCWTLGGKLMLSGSSVTSLDKLGTLQSATAIEISHTALTKLDTKQALAVTGDVSIHDNATLSDISNLAPATTIASLYVVNNGALADLAKLSTVQTIAGAVLFETNNKLATLDLSQVARIEGTLTIQNNAVLATTKLPALASVYTFTVRNNPVLTSFGSLGALQYVHGDLLIDNNVLLAGLSDAMTGTIATIDSSLTITNNPVLTSLGQLAHTGLAPTINISNNQQLGWCLAREVGCCVQHDGTATTQNDMNQNCQTHSWCYQQNGGCYAYTNN
jgi:hypothetical protein